jgi:hypothetical protein
MINRVHKGISNSSSTLTEHDIHMTSTLDSKSVVPFSFSSLLTRLCRLYNKFMIFNFRSELENLYSNQLVGMRVYPKVSGLAV